jgi:hypothetical protein
MSSSKEGTASAVPSLSQLAKSIHAELAAIDNGQSLALAHAIRAGELLNQAKAQIQHGGWLSWLAANFPHHVTTARDYMRLAANGANSLHFKTIAEALAAIRETKEPNVRASAPQPRTSIAEDPHVLTWIRDQTKLGLTVEDIIDASREQTSGWPRNDAKLSSGSMTACRAAIAAEDRVRAAAPAPSARRKPPSADKRLRTLDQQGRNGDRKKTDIWELQRAIQKAASTLEYYYLPQLDWSEDTDMVVAELFDDLGRISQWVAEAIDVTVAHMDDLGRQRTIGVLRARADDPSSTQPERENAARLASKLAQKRALAC